MSSFKFQVGDEVVVINDNNYHPEEEGMVKEIRFQDEKPIYIVSINDRRYPFHEEELNLKYSFSREEVLKGVYYVYDNSGDDMECYERHLMCLTFPMSALQIKNKFGSIILDQLLFIRSNEA